MKINIIYGILYSDNLKEYKDFFTMLSPKKGYCGIKLISYKEDEDIDWRNMPIPNNEQMLKVEQMIPEELKEYVPSVYGIWEGD